VSAAVELRLGAEPGGDVSPGVFGGFIEHFGTGLYGGIWDSEGGHPRSDVLAAVRGMRPTALRYPGGCFSDWYHWKDGIGPRSERPRYERQFWTGIQIEGIEIDPELSERFGPPETNAFGTDEFLRYCNDVGAEPLLTANFGTGTPEEAAEWVAYTNRRRSRRAPCAGGSSATRPGGTGSSGTAPRRTTAGASATSRRRCARSIRTSG
jgi:alpha-N-arabinofuranosidase